MRIHFRSSIRAALALMLALALPPARAAQDAGLTLTADAGGTRIEWRGPPLRDVTSPTGWQMVAIGGALVPARLVALTLPPGADAQPRIERLASVATAEAPRPAPRALPQTADGEERPDLAGPLPVEYPGAPITLIRDGTLRGRRIIVLAVSAVFEQAGATRALSELAATVAGARPLAAGDLGGGWQPAALQPPPAPPTNPAAAGQALKLRVAEAGIQRVTGAALAAAGLDVVALVPTRLHITRAGTPVPVELIGAGDGRLDPADELRFYAPPPGDRWNASDTYWLTIGASDGPLMAAQDALPAGPSASATAIERGVWYEPRLYDTVLPGPDGDHWFSADLRSGPDLPPAAISATLTPTLPLAGGPLTLVVRGSALTSGQHQLSAQAGSASATSAWSGAGDFERTFSLAESSATAIITLAQGPGPDAILIDSIAWERPAALDFGGRGAAFSTPPGPQQHQLANTPAGRALYDITDPGAPARLALPDGVSFVFRSDGAARSYLLAGPGTLHEPAVSAHAPVDLATPQGADALYIAPAELHAALGPLLALRAAQGRVARVIDAQAIYDSWSFGQLDPRAIRAFLRYAAATWSPAPVAVTLVGDGTADPLDHTRRGVNNRTLIPPYLAMVDPWLGETACDTCYAQLDGADPLDDPLPDLWLGRLPAKEANELALLVSKIISYETEAAGGAWRARAVFVADNHREADGTLDGAGDFAALSDQVVALQPAGLTSERIYYDPWPGRPPDPWREPDAALAEAKVTAAFSAGAALITFVGHSSQFQWAANVYQPDPSASAVYLPLLGPFTPSSLQNRGRLPVVLAMTCLSSAFQTQSFSGETIDERLLLNHAGGAVAVWGPTGLGVAHGHDALQRGFYGALWGERQERALGALVAAGYAEVFTTSPCCQDVLRTFVLLGDPLTPLRVEAGPQRIFLPLVQAQ